MQAKVLGLILAAILAVALVRWGYAEYWIVQHCTMILGTRVCR